MTARKIILDCDPGHDDAIAMLLAHGSPEIELVAVTTVAGNASLANVTRNALSVARIAGPTMTSLNWVAGMGLSSSKSTVSWLITATRRRSICKMAKRHMKIMPPPIIHKTSDQGS